MEEGKGRKYRRVTDALAYRDEYKQHSINLELDNNHSPPVFINVTVKSTDQARVSSTMRLIQKFLEETFKDG